MVNARPDTPQSTPRQSMTPFFIVWSGQAFSLIGSQLVQFALVWWLTKSSGSAIVLTLAMMMAILPQVLLGPIAGALIDRCNRRLVMIVADSIVALATLVLVVLFAVDAIQVWHIYVAMLVRATGAAFHWPAMQASTTLMVPEKHLSRIAGLNQSLNGAATIIAPPIGALLLELLPMQGVLAIDLVTATLAIMPLLFVFVPQPPRSLATSQAPVYVTVLADMREGFRFLWRWQGGMALLVAMSLVNLLLVPVVALAPLLVVERFMGGVMDLATLESVFGLGAVAGGLTLAVWGGFKRRVITSMTTLIFGGIGILLFGLLPATAFSLLVGVALFAGAMFPISNGSMFALLQAKVPPEMQGRVFTLLMSGSGAMSPVGLVIAGPVAAAFGVHAWYIVAGSLTIVMGVFALLIPAVARLEELAVPEPVAGIAESPASSN